MMKQARISGFVALALLASTHGSAIRADPVGGASTANQATARKSIGGWVSCTGVSDDTDGVARAIAAARHAAFTLVVDCPVRLHIGVDVARTIFIDNGTAIEFAGAGKFTVDNVFHPAFVIANSRDIVLTNWNVVYDASLPVDWKTGGYENAGKFVASGSNAPPAGAFNDLALTKWLAANRAIIFDRTQGLVNSIWAGPTNTSAVFFISGDTSNVTVTGMRLYAPPSAGAERFLPMAFSLSGNYKSNQTVTSATPKNAEFVATPHNLTFSGIDLDGTYMGWQGGAQNVIFEKIRSHRYSDLQDAKGENVGGVGKWFAPPHLIYLNYAVAGDPAFFNRDIRIHDVVDAGPRVGTARDKGGTDSLSGYANSIKIGCVHCSVDSYSSSRPDGFMDVLASDGLAVSNVTAAYDSTFLNNLFPALRFPQPPYKHVSFTNMVFKDLAESSVQMPISGANQESNEGISFSNVRIEVKRWAGKGLPLPVVAGHGNEMGLDYYSTAEDTRIVSTQRGGISLTFQATPSHVSPGGSTVLTWAAKGADNCSAAGGWSGNFGPSGTRTVRVGAVEGSEFTLSCQNSGESLTSTLRVAPQ